MLSTEDFLNLQQQDDQPEDTIRPVLISSFPKNPQELGIEIIQFHSTKNSAENTENQRNYFSVSDPCDKSIWYQVKTVKQTSYLLKLQYNRCVWDQPCFFPSPVSSMCYCNDTIVVGLEDTSINFIDSEFGLPCLPAIRIEGGIRYLKSYANNLIFCISNRKRVSIWNLAGPSELYNILDVQYNGDISFIKKVTITNELSTGELSPIIYFKDYAVRWSSSVNFWVGYNIDTPPFLEPNDEIQTSGDLEREFMQALIYHDGEKFTKTYFQLLEFYLQDPSAKNAMILIKQLLKRKCEQIDNYCGVDTNELLNQTMDMVGNKRPELVETIKSLNEYEIATKPKPPPTPDHIVSHRTRKSKSKFDSESDDDMDLIFAEEEENNDDIEFPEEETQHEEYRKSKKQNKIEETLQAPIPIPLLPVATPKPATEAKASLAHFMQLANNFEATMSQKTAEEKQQEEEQQQAEIPVPANPIPVNKTEEASQEVEEAKTTPKGKAKKETKPKASPRTRKVTLHAPQEQENALEVPDIPVPSPAIPTRKSPRAHKPFQTDDDEYNQEEEQVNEEEPVAAKQTKRGRKPAATTKRGKNAKAPQLDLIPLTPAPPTEESLHFQDIKIVVPQVDINDIIKNEENHEQANEENQEPASVVEQTEVKNEVVEEKTAPKRRGRPAKNAGHPAAVPTKAKTKVQEVEAQIREEAARQEEERRKKEEEKENDEEQKKKEEEQLRKQEEEERRKAEIEELKRKAEESKKNREKEEKMKDDMKKISQTIDDEDDISKVQNLVIKLPVTKKTRNSKKLKNQGTLDMFIKK